MALAQKQLESKGRDWEYKDSQAMTRLDAAQKEIEQLKQLKSVTTSAENSNPNSFAMFQEQQQVWSEELRRADERSSKFRAEINKLQSDNHGLLEQVRLLNERISTRDSEIGRLQVMTPSAGQYDLMQATHDRKKADDSLANLKKDNDFLSQQNQSLAGEMQELKELLGICESRDPTDMDRVHLKTLVRKMKQRNDQLQHENDEMGHIIQSFRDGNFNASEGAKMITDERISALQSELQTVQGAASQL